MKTVPMLDLKLEYEYMKNEIDSAIKKCLDHQSWILGPEVKELESKIAHYLDVKHCIGTSSGTEALVLSLRALAIKLKGQEYFDRTDEIITTPFTFTATGDAILRAGATPVFVDIDPVTYNVDHQKISEYVTQNSKLNAQNSGKIVGILPVHLYGQACQMDEIMAIANEYNLFVVEDVAQAFGGGWNGKKLGSLGTTGAFSFFPSKNLGCFGDGGMVSTNDDKIADLVRMLLKHGGKDKYNVDHVGYNARLDTLQAAILSAKLKYVDEFNERRRNIAETYNQGLQGLPSFMLPATSSPAQGNGDSHVYHQYTLSVKEGMRDRIQKHLAEKNIATMVYYPVPLHKMNVFHGRCRAAGNLENAEQASSSVLSLPVEPLQQNETTQVVVNAIREFCA